MKDAKNHLIISQKIINAIQKGELRRLKEIISSYGGPDNIDFTAIQGLKGELRIDETIIIKTEAFTPVLIAVACS